MRFARRIKPGARSQSQKTATAVETIRSQIAFGEWTKKEHRTLRRIKLEELVSHANDTEAWLLHSTIA
jgi:hypothetical protein